jgi:glycogen debranching enzyme
MQPQAWASAAPLLVIRALLGLEVQDGELRVDPVLPARATRLALRGVRFRGKRVDVG